MRFVANGISFLIDEDSIKENVSIFYSWFIIMMDTYNDHGQLDTISSSDTLI